jgi:hypothetical protein
MADLEIIKKLQNKREKSIPNSFEKDALLDSSDKIKSFLEKGI